MRTSPKKICNSAKFSPSHCAASEIPEMHFSTSGVFSTMGIFNDNNIKRKHFQVIYVLEIRKYILENYYKSKKKDF